MNTFMIVALVLIGLGILGLVYGQFTYTKDSDSGKLGPIQLTITEKKAVNVPAWAGAGAIALGTAILAFELIKHENR